MRSGRGQKKPAQKHLERKKCGQNIWARTKAQAQSPSYGILQCNREKTSPKIKQKKYRKSQRDCFRSLDDAHVACTALYTPSMATHGTVVLVPCEALLYLAPSKYLFLPSSRAHSSEITYVDSTTQNVKANKFILGRLCENQT